MFIVTEYAALSIFDIDIWLHGHIDELKPSLLFTHIKLAYAKTEYPPSKVNEGFSLEILRPTFSILTLTFISRQQNALLAGKQLKRYHVTMFLIIGIFLHAGFWIFATWLWWWLQIWRLCHCNRNTYRIASYIRLDGRSNMANSVCRRKHNTGEMSGVLFLCIMFWLWPVII